MSTIIFGDVTGNKNHFGPIYESIASNKIKNDLLTDIYDAVVTLQGRKYQQGIEDQKNDQFCDLLRQKDYSIGDQSRQGRSGSDKKKNYRSGELDIAVRQTHRSGTVKSIVEAFELKSCGSKNTKIKSHVNKLLNRYDTAGNKENFVIIYAGAKHFSNLWQKYLKHVDDFVFQGDSKIEPLSDDTFSKAYVKIAQNNLERGDSSCKLYHIFADFYKK